MILLMPEYGEGNMKKMYDIAAIGTMAYDMILGTVDETVFSRDTTLLKEVGVSPGGAAVIQSVTAARLGCRAAVVGKLCTDTFSDYVIEVLKKAEVDISNIKRSDSDTMSLTFALVKENGDRHFLGRAGSHNQTLCLEDFNLDIVRQAAIVSYGSFFFLKGLDAGGVSIILKTAKEAGAATVADCASDSFNQGPEIVYRNLEFLDYFMPSYVEAEYLTKEKEPSRMAEVFLKKGCRNVIIKLGGEGCYVTDGRRGKVLPPISHIKVSDTTGAGDSFVGGFMAGLTKRMDIWEAARYANAVAGVSVTGMGGLTALKDESQVLELLNES